MGEDFSAYHAAACLQCLPSGSMTLSAIDPRCSWTAAEYMLHGLLTALAGKELPYPWEAKKGGIDGIETEPLPLEEFKEWYENTSWKEVENWQVL